ncbi:MAG: transposase [Erysipelothrix sp.]|nr:transposase [Erysipelothrix sp.]
MKSPQFIEANQSDYRLDYTPLQLVLPIDMFNYIGKDDSIHTFMEVIGGINLKAFINSKHIGRQEYEDTMMLRIILFAYTENITSLRAIEKACRVDTRFIWIANGKRPSFMAFQRFINEKIKGSINDIFTAINNYIIDADDVDIDTLYLDGTKIEANATKFSFVWKKSILNYQDKLMDKVTREIDLMKHHSSLRFVTKETYESKDILKIQTALYRYLADNGIELVYGSGKRKHPVQRHYDIIKELQMKAETYERHLEIMGERNSYSKTDHDATFMHGKEDYYSRTGIFKPYYNVQIGVSDEYITHLKLFPNPTDTKTFKPFFDSYYERYGVYPSYPVADAGYGSYDNYLYCLEKGMGLWQKYGKYSKEKESKFKKELYNTKNMTQGHLSFTSENGYLFEHVYDRTSNKSEIPYITQIYQCKEWTETLKQEGMPRSISYNPVLSELHNKAKENLDSDHGIRLKTQRSIQVEGAFGVIKSNMKYNRFHRRGSKNVENEMILIAIGYNIKKYHMKKKRTIH